MTSASISSLITTFLGTVQVTIMYRIIIDIGFQNILYVITLFVAGRLVHPMVFTVGTSYVHYLRYMTTYYNRKDVNFGTFKSDVLLFKILALAQIAVRYLSVLAVGASASSTILAASLVMIVSGATVSSLATHALGMDATYFGKELGLCNSPWVSSFPYNCIPHPMIVGQLIALSGVHLVPEFRATWPWLVPVHCLLYTLVMLQEHFDVHREGKGGRSGGSSKVKST